MERVKSSDVLDVTHEVVKPFQGEVLGRFRRVGPNSWDDYELVRKPNPARLAGGAPPGESGQPGSVPAAAEFVELGTLVPVQLESRGGEVRFRTDGRVLLVRFVPTDAERLQLTRQLGESFEPRTYARALRDHFEATHLRRLGEGPTLGATAVIVSKLGEK